MGLSRFVRLFRSLTMTRRSLVEALKDIATGGISSQALQALESLLLSSDVGIETTDMIMDWLVSGRSKGNLKESLREYLVSLLTGSTDAVSSASKKTAILIVGVNGSGKTTTAAKLGHYLKEQGHSVLLIAADTYRAAAVEQLRRWSDTVCIQLICNESSRDPSSVIFDGLQAAEARGYDFSIIDTAGRLHTYKNLMSEVEKMHRVATTRFPGFRVLTYLTLDANLGQNSLVQAREFNQHAPLDGIILTKMDGTAKGGIVFPVCQELGLPVKFLGVGETLDDLVEFDADEYVSSLLGTSEHDS